MTRLVFGVQRNHFLHSRLLSSFLLMLALRLYARSRVSSNIGGSEINKNRYDPKYICGMCMAYSHLSLRDIDSAQRLGLPMMVARGRYTHTRPLHR